MSARPMSEREHRQIINKQRNLPEQLLRARLRVRHLEQEARRLSMIELLNDPHVLDKAWEREMELAQIKEASKP